MILRQAMFVTASILTLFFTGCENKQTQAENNKTKTTITYTAIVDTEYPPYGLLDDTGKAIGFDVDILSAIAKDQGFNIKFTSASWQTLLYSLEHKEHQIAMGAIWAPDIENEKHTNNYSFSSPYSYSVDAIATLPSTTGIHSFDDLKKYRVPTLKDSSYVNDLIELKEIPKVNQDIVAEETAFLAFQKMLRKEVDATLLDVGVFQYFKKNNPQLKFNLHQEGDYFSEPYELVYLVNRENPELNKKIQLGLQHIIQSGTYHNIYKKWFGTDPKKLPN